MSTRWRISDDDSRDAVFFRDIFFFRWEAEDPRNALLAFTCHRIFRGEHSAINIVDVMIYRDDSDPLKFATRPFRPGSWITVDL